jgi:hypothetical protein
MNYSVYRPRDISPLYAPIKKPVSDLKPVALVNPNQKNRKSGLPFKPYKMNKGIPLFQQMGGKKEKMIGSSSGSSGSSSKSSDNKVRPGTIQTTLTSSKKSYRQAPNNTVKINKRM